MELVPIRCKSCGANIAQENISMKLAMARCNHCDAVFAITGHDASSSQTKTIPREEVPMPSGITVTDLGHTLEIKRSWFNWSAIFLVFFCVIWNGFMIVWHSIALSQGMWFMSLFGIIHTIVGLVVLYSTAAMFVNSTIIRVGRGMMEIRHGPMPWSGNKDLSVHDIKQLYCREKIKHSKNGTHYTYMVEARTDSGARRELLKNLQSSDQALFLEQAIEQHLGIEDEAVQGELPR